MVKIGPSLGSSRHPYPTLHNWPQNVTTPLALIHHLLSNWMNTATFLADKQQHILNHFVFLSLIASDISSTSLDLQLSQVQSLLPVKGVQSPPFARHDGGGFPSQADWSMEHTADDSFSVLRRNWMNHIMSHNLHKKVFARISQGYDGPPLSDQDLLPLKAYLDEFLFAQGVSPCWDISADQPMCLHILKALCNIMDDPDKSIFGYLKSGVPIGRDVSIQPSNCFPLKTSKEESTETPLTVHLCNWQSAESDPATVQELIDKEVAEGWVDVVNGGFAEAHNPNIPKGLPLENSALH